MDEPEEGAASVLEIPFGFDSHQRPIFFRFTHFPSLRSFGFLRFLSGPNSLLPVRSDHRVLHLLISLIFFTKPSPQYTIRRTPGPRYLSPIHRFLFPRNIPTRSRQSVTPLPFGSLRSPRAHPRWNRNQSSPCATCGNGQSNSDSPSSHNGVATSRAVTETSTVVPDRLVVQDCLSGYSPTR